jgi:hypothetical protein
MLRTVNPESMRCNFAMEVNLGVDGVPPTLREKRAKDGPPAYGDLIPRIVSVLMKPTSQFPAGRPNDRRVSP